MRAKWLGLLLVVVACGTEESAPKVGLADGRSVQPVASSDPGSVPVAANPALPFLAPPNDDGPVTGENPQQPNPPVAPNGGGTGDAGVVQPPPADSGTPPLVADAGAGGMDAGEPKAVDAGAPDAGEPSPTPFTSCGNPDLYEPATRGIESFSEGCDTSAESQAGHDWCFCAGTWMVEHLSCEQFLARGQAESDAIAAACGVRP